MFDSIVADGAQVERLPDGAVDVTHLEGFKKAQDLDILALARLTHPRLQQPVQGRELFRQIPALQWGCLV